MNYNFNKLLDSTTFEQFSKDILEIRENLEFEIFGEGKDNGIDLRCQNNEKLIIAQVKKYDNFNSLFSHLKNKELKKVKKLNPNRYILVVSVKLTPERKRKIKELFDNFIINENDIIGEEQLNSMLRTPKYKSIENEYYQLWINSSNVLRNLIKEEVNNDIYVQSKHELNEIQKSSKIYVKSTIFEKALLKLNKNKCILICGEPGIGKSILARNLCAYFMNKNKDMQFVFVNNVKEVQRVYNEEKSQIFFLDDFWGSKLDSNFKGNEEYLLKRIIQMIRSSKNKMLILTSREYILKEGYAEYPELEGFFDKYKFQMSINDYSDLVKAKILFRHLNNSKLDKNIVFQLAEGYKEIIYNDNYNPRIIEELIENLENEEYQIDNYLNFFLKYLNNPEELWKSIFKKQCEGAQLIAILMIVFNNPIEIDEIKRLFYKCIDYDFRINARKKDFNKYISQLENTIITTYKDDCYSDDKVFVKFKNSSIELYIFKYFNENLDEYAKNIIMNSEYLNNLMYLIGYWNFFDNINHHIPKFEKINLNINLSRELKKMIVNKIIDDFDTLDFKDEGIYFNDYSEKYKQYPDKLIILINLLKQYPDENLRKFVIEKIKCVIDDLSDFNMCYDDTFAIPRLIYESISSNLYTNIDILKSINDLWKTIEFSRQFLILKSFKKYFPLEYNEFIRDKNMEEIIIDFTFRDAEYFLEDGMYYALDELIDATIPSLFDEFKIKYKKSYLDEFYYLTDRILHADKKRLKERFESYDSSSDEELIRIAQRQDMKRKREKEIIEQEKCKLINNYCN